MPASLLVFLRGKKKKKKDKKARTTIRGGRERKPHGQAQARKHRTGFVLWKVKGLALRKEVLRTLRTIPN